jgi:uncharacterized protein
MDLIIDSDSHVTEPADVWTSRVPRRYVDRVPRVEKDASGADIWVLDGVRIDTVGVTAPAGFPGFPAARPTVYEELLPAAYDSTERLKYLNEAGIWAQVLFPNVGGFGSGQFRRIPDQELQVLCLRAFNDFMHEWCSVDPRRLLPLIAIPFWDVEESVKEMERCIEMGFRGLLFTGEPQRFGCPVLGDRSWDPIWSLAQEAKLPVHFHIGAGEDNLTDLMTPRLDAHGKAGMEAYAAVFLFMKNGVQCADLITSGVLARFEELKFVSVESGVGWVPFMLEAADYSFLGATAADRKRSGDILPSDLFRRQVYTTYWFEQVASQRMLDELPLDNVLFETDFPHVTCLYGNIQDTIDTNLGHVADEVRRKILWSNAATLYGIDEPLPDDLAKMPQHSMV